MDGISEVLGGIGSSGASGSTGSILDQEDFLKIMISELSNQDPLEPLDNNQFLNQLTQMQTLQATTQLTESLEGLVLGQQINSAGALIGRSVVGIDPGGSLVEGVVDRVLVEDGSVRLGVGEQSLAMAEVRQILAAPESETE